jgi:hypothetical protein
VIKTISQRFYNLIDKSILETLKTRSKELEDLFETAKILEDYFLSELILTDAHISNITGGKFGSKFGLSLKYKQCIEMVYLENTVLDLILNLLSELGESLRSMLIGNYGSVSRSLRWIVEYTIFWVYMQNDRKESAKHRFERYYEESMTKRYFNYLSTQVFDINACKLEERLHFKEEYGRPTFDDMRKSLSMFDNAPKEIQEIPEKIKKLYHEFSSMIHVSLNSLDQLRMSGRFPVFMDYYYEKETFDSTIEKIWKAIDLITAIIIMESSIFLWL